MSDYPVGTVSIEDSQYPSLLKQIPNPPEVLHYKGIWQDEIFENCLGVVGSRRMTTYGRKVAENLVFELAGRGLTIVSGFMYGIDATAHRAALDAGGTTIAVMPCGIDIVHPSHQDELYDKILSNGGLIISEYQDTQSPQKWLYPERNRIVAGLSRGVLVVEAARNSGSLITAGLAEKYKRHLFAVPGNINSATSEGTLDLIKKGAHMVRKSADVLQVLGIEGVSDKFFSASNISNNELLNLISSEPMTTDELSRATKTPSDALSNELTLLMLNGEIFEENGKYYVS